LPRDLGDVLHYFIPDGEAGPRQSGPPIATRSIARSTPKVLPIVGVPIGDRDVVRAAFTWNLTVEIARLGASAVLLAPTLDERSPLWPEPGPGPLGAEVVLGACEDLGELHRAALDLAVSRTENVGSEGGVVFVRIPPRWLREISEGGNLLRWTLLFSSTDPSDLRETYGIAKLLMNSNPAARVGVTIHGVKRVDDARRAFGQLAGSAARHLGREISSYGLLVDDLDVYRAIVAQRPIGLVHPQSPAARALRDVARLVLEDARAFTVV